MAGERTKSMLMFLTNSCNALDKELQFFLIYSKSRYSKNIYLSLFIVNYIYFDTQNKQQVYIQKGKYT